MEINVHILEAALIERGRRVDWGGEINLLIVGGAAAMITGLLPATRTTIDCDVIDYEPAAAMARVELAADDVGHAMGLPKNWLNSNVQIRKDSLPSGWKSRRIRIGSYGPLTIHAASRIDIIAMKFLAHRPVDLVDLQDLKVTAADAKFVKDFLDRIQKSGSNAQEIEEARRYLDDWDYAP